MTVFYSNIVLLNIKLFTKYLRRHPSKLFDTDVFEENEKIEEETKEHPASEINLDGKSLFFSIALSFIFIEEVCCKKNVVIVITPLQILFEVRCRLICIKPSNIGYHKSLIRCYHR